MISLLAEKAVDTFIACSVIAKEDRKGQESSIEFLYSSGVSFAEYYFEKFSTITVENLYCLLNRIIQSEKINKLTLQRLEKTITDRLYEYDTKSQ